MAQSAGGWVSPRGEDGSCARVSTRSRSPYRGPDVRIILIIERSSLASAIFATNWCPSMTSTSARSGMPAHFGIRITDADKDKLVGELDVDDRHLNNSGHVHGGALVAFADDLVGHWPGSTSRLSFGQLRLSRRRIFFAPASEGGFYRRCCPGPCRATRDRPANLDLPPGRKACRNDHPTSEMVLPRDSGTPAAPRNPRHRRWRAPRRTRSRNRR